MVQEVGLTAWRFEGVHPEEGLVVVWVYTYSLCEYHAINCFKHFNPNLSYLQHEQYIEK